MTNHHTHDDNRTAVQANDDTSGFAADYFLQIEGVKGEKPKTIEVQSFSWGLSQQGTFGSGR